MWPDQASNPGPLTYESGTRILYHLLTDTLPPTMTVSIKYYTGSFRQSLLRNFPTNTTMADSLQTPLVPPKLEKKCHGKIELNQSWSYV